MPGKRKERAEVRLHIRSCLSGEINTYKGQNMDRYGLEKKKKLRDGK